MTRWTPLTRAAFRFLFVYLGLYSFASQIAGGVLLLPGLAFPSLGTRWPMREITLWLAAHVFGVAGPLVYAGNSGDTVFHWIQTLWLLTLAAAITALWLRFDRLRTDDVRLHRWFRLFIRFGLAAQLFYFGMAKVIPAQFPPPSLVTLVEPVGQLSRTDLLWTFIGSSTAYQMFAGWTEVIGGILLVIPDDRHDRCHRRAGRHDTRAGVEHGVRRRAEADLVSSDPHVAVPSRTGSSASCERLVGTSAGR